MTHLVHYAVHALYQHDILQLIHICYFMCCGIKIHFYWKLCALLSMKIMSSLKVYVDNEWEWEEERMRKWKAPKAVSCAKKTNKHENIRTYEFSRSMLMISGCKLTISIVLNNNGKHSHLDAFIFNITGIIFHWATFVYNITMLNLALFFINLHIDRYKMSSFWFSFYSFSLFLHIFYFICAINFDITDLSFPYTYTHKQCCT